MEAAVGHQRVGRVHEEPVGLHGLAVVRLRPQAHVAVGGSAGAVRSGRTMPLARLLRREKKLVLECPGS